MSNEIQTISAGHQLSVESMRSHVSIIEEMTKAVMKQDMHYGIIPGCGDKPTLLQPGAQKLALAFQLSVEPEVEWHDLPGGHREYHVRCHLIARANGIRVGTGLGNCSTMESRYRFRTQNTGEIVPAEYWNNRDPEILGGRQFSPRKIKGGDGQPDQWMIMEKIEHDNPADYFNTCEKMAKKRAFIDAILTCTAASDHFTQDIEDDPDLYGAGTAPAAKSTPAKSAQRQQSSRQQSSDGQDNDPIVQFGKHKGKKFSELPNDYLQWCIDNAQKDYIRDAARKEMDRRANNQDNPAKSTPAPAAKSAQASEDEIRAIHAKLDKNDLTMKELLAVFDLDSSSQIKSCDVAPILTWLDDPMQRPPQLPAF